MAQSTIAYALQQPQALYILLILAVLVFLIGVLSQLRHSKGDTVLLVGPCGAGKTTLLQQLEGVHAKQGTVTSMEENVSMVAVPAGQDGKTREVRLVDVPGHARIAHRIFSEHVERARGIIFMVDSVDFMSHRVAVAEQLYDVLTHPEVDRRRLPVLLAANKVDCGARAHTVEFIRKRLEKALSEARGTRSALASTDGGQGSDVLAKAGEPFTFEGLTKAYGARLSIASVSAREGDIEPIWHFLVKAA